MTKKRLVEPLAFGLRPDYGKPECMVRRLVASLVIVHSPKDSFEDGGQCHRVAESGKRGVFLCEPWFYPRLVAYGCSDHTEYTQEIKLWTGRLESRPKPIKRRVSSLEDSGESAVAGVAPARSPATDPDPDLEIPDSD
jgi:hypothetical protein